jgi:hypothetical protein
MADNATLKSDATTTVFVAALDEVTYSGDAAKLPLVRLVKVTGAEGSKTIGSLNHHVIGGASTNTGSISANPTELHSVRVFNAQPYTIYVKFHNTAGVPTAGAGVVLTIGCQAGQSRDVNYPGGLGIFTTGLGRSIVKGIADADTTVLDAANACVVDVEYTRVS